MPASVNEHRKHFAMCHFLSPYKRSWFGKFLPVKWLNTFQTAHWQSQTNQYLQGTSPPSWLEAPAATMAPWSWGGYTNFRGKQKKTLHDTRGDRKLSWLQHRPALHPPSVFFVELRGVHWMPSAHHEVSVLSLFVITIRDTHTCALLSQRIHLDMTQNVFK